MKYHGESSQPNVPPQEERHPSKSLAEEDRRRQSRRAKATRTFRVLPLECKADRRKGHPITPKHRICRFQPLTTHTCVAGGTTAAGGAIQGCLNTCLPYTKQAAWPATRPMSQ